MKIIGIIFVSLMFANIGFAEIRDIKYKHLDGATANTICVDGYKFVIYANRGENMVQAFEERDGKSLPTKC